MALLSMCVGCGLDVIAAFVNYKLRETADLEEKLVEKYCAEHEIKMYCHYPIQNEKGNFQKWAREARYDFFRQLYYENDCEALLLGHQMDDCIENYLMSKARKSKGYYYGMVENCYHHGMNIIRPLLSYRKADLRAFCQDNNIPFHDDESNFSDKYQRNRIRHSLVEKASLQQIDDWMAEIKQYNYSQDELRSYFLENYPLREMMELAAFRKEPRKEELLRWYLYQHDSEKTYSSKQIQDMARALESSDRGYKNLGGDSQLVWEYGYLYVFNTAGKYEYVLEEIEYLETPYFKISDKGDRIQGITVTKDDFPLTIRPYGNEDVIRLRFGHKKVSRQMIDNKVFKKDRYLWPVVLNKNGRVIFVAGIGCDVEHYSENPSLYVL